MGLVFVNTSDAADENLSTGSPRRDSPGRSTDMILPERAVRKNSLTKSELIQQISPETSPPRQLLQQPLIERRKSPLG